MQVTKEWRIHCAMKNATAAEANLWTCTNSARSQFERKISQLLLPTKRRFDRPESDNPTMLRTWNGHSSTRPFAEVKRSHFWNTFSMEFYMEAAFRAPAIRQLRIRKPTNSVRDFSKYSCCYFLVLLLRCLLLLATRYSIGYCYLM